MKQITTLGLSLVLATGLATTASAQTAQSTSSPSTAGNLTTAAPTGTTAVKKKPTTATADMVNEAIQRSEARAAKALQSGTPQQWGSEEPFTYNPAVKNFNANQQ